jgi:hypothetical protein
VLSDIEGCEDFDLEVGKATVQINPDKTSVDDVIQAINTKTKYKASQA